jgi:DNA-binding NtrC family response regulator
MRKKLTVLVVDDEQGLRDLLRLEFEGHGMAVDTAADGAEGLRMVQEKHFDVVVTDITMPEMDGLKFLESLKKVSPQTQVIMVTGFGAVETAVYAMQNGARDFVLKPYDVGYLIQSINRVMKEIIRCPLCGEKKHAASKLSGQKTDDCSRC